MASQTAKTVVNGYFYKMIYHATKVDKYNHMPIIYCIMPDNRNINCFWGLNFNLFEPKIQNIIFNNFVNRYDLINDERRIYIKPEDMVNIYRNFKEGVRCYNRKNVVAIKQIHFNEIPKLLKFDEDYINMSQKEQNVKSELTMNTKGF